MKKIATRDVLMGDQETSTNVVPFPLKDRAGAPPTATALESLRASQKRIVRPSVLTGTGPDAAPRWVPGERLNHILEQSCARHGLRTAVATDDVTLSFTDLDERANQLARFLIANGVRPGDRLGLLFDRTAETYIAMLATLKANAAYVPLDAAFPKSRLEFIVGDAALTAIVSMSALEKKLDGIDCRQFFLDTLAPAIAAERPDRLAQTEVAPAANEICYIIYTSGTTGNPKGVVIEHASICNFVRVASASYGFRPGDRVYQGMTIAFDFSVEEIWVPLVAGSTLIPGRQGRNLVGSELGDFLDERRVTCLCCCPTLLSSIERDLPHLRTLLLGGEACPQNLVTRWHRQGRTILNSYGPTEATVTAMLTELHPEKPVTIGEPLATYSIVILDPETDRAMPVGELGEIGIAGIGVALGYLNNDELTTKKFIPDFLAISNNPSRRIYRTGDLGRLNADDEVEYLGRIDSQVKIRGYRIELSEIEAVLLAFPGITQAAVTTFAPEPGMVELVAYYVFASNGASPSRDEIARALRANLPAYMVPAYLEELSALPMSVSNKTDYKKLPPPAAPRFIPTSAHTPAETDAEKALVALLATTLRFDQISVDADFFQDLGANSLLMARFCSDARKLSASAHISMQDIYMCPTIRTLAAHLERRAGEGRTVLSRDPEPLHIPSTFAYWGCGALQLGFFGAYTLLVLALVSAGYDWTMKATTGSLDFFWRASVVSAGLFTILSALPVAAKWLLVGRAEPATFPIWSLRYFRFWLVKTLVRSAPASLFVGTPIFNVYLRLLGARIGRNVVIHARYVPACPDLFSVGDNTVLRKDSILLGYRAQLNRIETGRIAIGANAFIGEAAVLDIDTAMADGTQLGHASSLQSGQRVAAGKRVHGSPAIETSADYCPISDLPPNRVRRALYAFATLAATIVATGPLVLLVAALLPDTATATAARAADPLSGLALLSILTTSLIIYASAIAAGLAAVLVIPRLCQPFLKEGRIYPMYGLHYVLHRIVFTTSNSRYYTLLFGDSSYIVNYMRWIGWNLGQVEQTGSNFGTNQRHDNPFLSRIGSGTMVSDGLSMINIHMSSTSFCLKRAQVGPQNYLGNDIHYPPDARTGADCLLGTKVLIPIDGPVREGVGLLGSPSFEIPRMVERDRSLIAAIDEPTRRQRLREKNRYNLITIALFLMTRWVYLALTLFAFELAIAGNAQLGIFSWFFAITGLAIASVVYYALIERSSLLFGRLKSSMITIYDPDFWYHERHWKLADSMIVGMMAGTPFRNIISRMLGVKVGRKVYDAGAVVTERTLTEIGDYANLNEASVLQAHSLEEGAFKSDTIRIGEGASIGPAAFIHYGVTTGREVIVDADSFVMKGETLEPRTGWRGNPAKLHRRPEAAGSAPAVSKPAVRTVVGVPIDQFFRRPQAAALPSAATDAGPPANDITRAEAQA